VVTHVSTFFSLGCAWELGAVRSQSNGEKMCGELRVHTSWELLSSREIIVSFSCVVGTPAFIQV
jgi:hypothetical protein